MVILKQFIAILLSDSRILIRFFIVSAKLERALFSAKLWAESANIKKEESLKKMINQIGPTIELCGTPDVISSKVLLMLFTMKNCFLLFRY